MKKSDSLTPLRKLGYESGIGSESIVYNMFYVYFILFLTTVAGIPSDCFQNTHAVPINDAEALEAEILKYQDDGGVAAFIMEAVGQDSGAVPTTKEYH